MLYLRTCEKRSMRVLIINTSERTGGAAVAANRLKDALNNNGVKTKMLVRDKQTDDLTVVGIGGGWRSRWAFLWERICIFWHLRFSRKHLFDIDIANAGHSITRLPEFKEADIIHLHWINQGMLSLKEIRRILDSGKPVVWTMHDMWPATGICHYSRGCSNYHSRCNHCRLLPHNGSSKDISSIIWNRKQKILHDYHIFFVTCSKWLAIQAKKSALLDGHAVVSIPNPIETHKFYPKTDSNVYKDLGLPDNKRVVLFVSQRVTDERKGMQYFIKAIEILLKRHPEMKENTVIAILGGHSDEIAEQLMLPTFPLGYVSNPQKIVDIYNASDVFVLPSLEDNLPNTIMEAMACGVPCVGFKVGGIPEMIDHKKNGYVAKYKSSEDLAEGLSWVLDEADYAALSAAAIQKVQRNYSQSAVAQRYIEVYNEAMALKNYKL